MNKLHIYENLITLFINDELDSCIRSGMCTSEIYSCFCKYISLYGNHTIGIKFFTKTLFINGYIRIRRRLLGVRMYTFEKIPNFV